MAFPTSQRLVEVPAKRRFLLNRAFRLFWSGQTVSVLGSHITGSGLPLMALLVLGATPLQVGLLAALGALPHLLGSLFMGVLVDRLPRRPLMLLADLVRALLLLSLPLAFLCGLLNITLIYLVTILLGICTICFDAASQAFLPQIIADDLLLEANSKMASSASLAEIGGPPLAGGLVQLIGAPLAVVFDALSFLVSALSIGLIRAHEIQPTPLTSEHASIWREIALGLHVLRKQSRLRKLACYATVQTFCGGAFAALYTIFVIRELGLAPVLYGVLVALGGVGALIGSLILPRLNRRWGMQRTLVSGTMLHGMLALATPCVSGPTLFVFAILGLSQLIGDIGYQLFAISEISLRQNSIPVQMQGRVNAVMIFLIGGIAPLGTLLASIVCLFIGVRLTLLCGASGMLLSALWLGFVLRKEAQ